MAKTLSGEYVFGVKPPILSAGTSCLLSGFDMHGEIDAFGSDQEYIK